MIRQFSLLSASMGILFPAEKNEFILLLKKFVTLASLYLDQEKTGSVAVDSCSLPDGLIGVLNQLARYCAGSSFAQQLNLLLKEGAFAVYQQWCKGEKTGGTDGKIPADFAFYLEHCRKLEDGFRTLIPDFVCCLEEREQEKRNLLYPSVSLLTSSAGMLEPADLLLQQFQERGMQERCFGASRVYRYLEGKFLPLQLKQIRRIDEFYGYHEARRLMMEHYGDFAAGKDNLPLLISSLPGLGKTQMTISHVLHFENLILILPGPGDMAEGLEHLIGSLEQYPDQRFVLFFDDIDTVSVNWYSFRMRVGGAFSLPGNISVTVASNLDFPPNISSRGRGFTYPVFDEIRCMEMVGDYLTGKGMRNPSSNLVSVIAADYVEQFGQRKFEELSPRTLIRYLDRLDGDEKSRSMMLKISQSAMIPRPDSQIFYAENLKLMR